MGISDLHNAQSTTLSAQRQESHHASMTSAKKSILGMARPSHVKLTSLGKAYLARYRKTFLCMVPPRYLLLTVTCNA